jgi:hypothetical protein
VFYLFRILEGIVWIVGGFGWLGASFLVKHPPEISVALLALHKSV